MERAPEKGSPKTTLSHRGKPFMGKPSIEKTGTTTVIVP
jgi:hypothetical protein